MSIASIEHNHIGTGSEQPGEAASKPGDPLAKDWTT
jgi:hypothetical protein